MGKLGGQLQLFLHDGLERRMTSEDSDVLPEASGLEEKNP